MGTYPFEGATRRVYSYSVVMRRNLASTPIKQGGNFLFTRLNGGVTEIVYAGEARHLDEAILAQEPWSTAQREHGAIRVYFHTNPEALERIQERDDLVAKHRPPMNVEDRTAE